MAGPIIAVTGPQRGAWGPRFCVAWALRHYGARPLQLRPDARGRLPEFDGLVVTGGHDIDPVLYGMESEVMPRYDAERDALEQETINRALAEGRPVLGICRGAQLLNVCRGGSLTQDLRRVRRHTSNRRSLLPLKHLVVEPDTVLRELLARPEARINSLHNQAIDRLGDGLKVSGRDQDGIVQAVEDPDYPFLLGVQWHPEFLLYARSQRRLFRALVAAAQAR